MKKPRSAAGSNPPRQLRSTTSGATRELGGGSAPRTKAGSGSGTPRRPREVKAGGGARLIAPIALVVFAIACFGVISSSGNDDNASNSGAAAAERSGESENNSGAAVENNSEPTRSTYRVKAGDSFSAIAERFGVDANTLTELNPDIDPRALQPGQKLKLK